MPFRVGNSRRKFVAVVAFLALQAGLAAGPIRAGAEAEPAARSAGQPAPGLAAGPPVVATVESPAAPTPPATTDAPPAPPAPAPAAPAPSPAAALVPPERLHFQPILEQAAAQNGLPADLVQAMAWAESSWRTDAVSNIGALGILQLTPDTVDFVSKNLLHLDHDLDVLDPVANARMSGVYLKHLLEHTDNDLRRALMAYNQGLRSLYQDGPDPDAESYADKVLALRPVFGG
jgi:soluble lytic murein transglycosylase-like protein